MGKKAIQRYYLVEDGKIIVASGIANVEYCGYLYTNKDVYKLDAPSHKKYKIIKVYDSEDNDYLTKNLVWSHNKETKRLIECDDSEIDYIHKIMSKNKYTYNHKIWLRAIAGLKRRRKINKIKEKINDGKN